jgi:hypothetical protein
LAEEFHRLGRHFTLGPGSLLFSATCQLISIRR